MPYDLNAIRQKMKQMDSRKSDPDEFRPGKAKPNELLKYRFYVLPAVQEGDILKSGVAKKAMDVFYSNYGQHWIKNQPHACPRIYDGGECKICDTGFQLMKAKGLSDQDKQQLRQDWMPNSSYCVNIYFPNWKNNPEELRGRVMYYKAPKTVFDKWVACINTDAPESDAYEEGDDREAHGAFFDENAAWVFELQVELSGKSNSYKTSKFIVPSDGQPTPIVKTADGSPDKKAIANIMASRIDIWSRLDVPNSKKMSQLADSLLHGDDEVETGGKFHVQEEDDEEVSTPKASKASAAKPKKEAAVVEEDEDDAPPPKAKSRKVEDDEDDAPPPPKAKAKQVIEEDDDDSEIDNLLGQLDDE